MFWYPTCANECAHKCAHTCVWANTDTYLKKHNTQESDINTVHLLSTPPHSFREGVKELYLVFHNNMSKNNWSAEVAITNFKGWWDYPICGWDEYFWCFASDRYLFRCTSRGRLWVAGGTWKSMWCSRLATQSRLSQAHKMTKKCISISCSVQQCFSFWISIFHVLI